MPELKKLWNLYVSFSFIKYFKRCLKWRYFTLILYKNFSFQIHIHWNLGVTIILQWKGIAQFNSPVGHLIQKWQQIWMFVCKNYIILNYEYVCGSWYVYMCTPFLLESRETLWSWTYRWPLNCPPWLLEPKRVSSQRADILNGWAIFPSGCSPLSFWMLSWRNKPLLD